MDILGRPERYNHQRKTAGWVVGSPCFFIAEDLIPRRLRRSCSWIRIILKNLNRNEIYDENSTCKPKTIFVD
jgi:hypothetical protein